MKIKYLILITWIWLTVDCSGQPAFSEEKNLWICPSKSKLIIKCRFSNYMNSIEINGPEEMDSNTVITGTLYINRGTFKPPEELTPAEMTNLIVSGKKTNSQGEFIQSKVLFIKGEFFSQNISYYNTEVKPDIRFEGTCSSNAESDLNTICTISTAIRLPLDLVKKGLSCTVGKDIISCKEIVEVLTNPISDWKGKVNDCNVGIQKFNKGTKEKDGTIMVDAIITITGIKREVTDLINKIAPSAQ